MQLERWHIICVLLFVAVPLMFLFLWWLNKPCDSHHQTVRAEIVSVTTKDGDQAESEDFPYVVSLKHAAGGFTAEVSRSMGAGLRAGMKMEATFWRTKSGLYRIDDFVQTS